MIVDDKVILKYKCEFDGKIPSVNDMYRIGRSGNKTWLYLNPDVDQYKGRLKTQLELGGVYTDLNEVDEMFPDSAPVMVRVEAVFVYSQNFWVRDLTNLIKATEDAVVEMIHIDDSVTVGFNSSKIYNDVDDYEYLILIMTIQNKDEESIKLSNYTGE